METRRPTEAEAGERIDAATALLTTHATMTVAVSEAGWPWISRAFFVEDEPQPGALDLCCSLLLSQERRAQFAERPRASIFVGSDEPDRWITARGVVTLVDDEADAAAIVKRLEEKHAGAGRFVARSGCSAIRVNLVSMTTTDLDAEPPVSRFSFA